MLEYHADTERPGMSRVANPHRLALPFNGASIGRSDTVNDFHQSGFASAVFAQHGMNFPRHDGQIDRIIRHH